MRGFRKRAPGKKLGGWYSDDLFHIFAQVLSGLSRLHAATSDTACRDKVHYLIDERARRRRRWGWRYAESCGGFVEATVDEAGGAGEETVVEHRESSGWHGLLGPVVFLFRESGVVDRAEVDDVDLGLNMYRDKRSHRHNGKQKQVEPQNENQPQVHTTAELYEANKTPSANKTPLSEKRVDADMKKPMNIRICVVIRVSRTTSTTENQRYGLLRHLDKLPYEPLILDVTGSNWNAPIPEFDKIIAEISLGEYDEIHFWTTDRLGRNHAWDMNFWDVCADKGVLLRFISDDLRSDRVGDYNKFLQKSLDAKVERDRSADRINLAFQRMKGEWVSKLYPKQYPDYIAAVRLDEQDGGDRANSLYKSLYKQAKASKKDFRGALGKGKEKGNQQQKTLKATRAILAMNKDGISMRQIAKDLDLCPRTIKAVIKLHNAS